MEQGFSGVGNIPMIPSYLSLNTRPVVGQPCCVLTAGPVIRSCSPGQICTMVIEGSQLRKLTGFGDLFRKELHDLLKSGEITVVIKEVDNSCLIGAAIAAFAEPM